MWTRRSGGVGREGNPPGEHLGCSVNVLDFDFKAPEPLGQKVIERGENHKEHETQNASEDRPQNVKYSDDSHLVVTEDNHWNADHSVDTAHQDIESGHYLAGLKNGDADQLLSHGF
jgi:hypothetical protein